jgi:abortive infection bacteriophage resistance protein
VTSRSDSSSAVSEKVPFTKAPKTFAEQVQILQGHGLIIPDVAKAEFYLSHLNYYRFAAYCLPFEQDHATHTFQAGVTFDDVLNIYIFDRELRLLLMDAIERIEVSLRTQLAYHLSHRYGTPHPHLNPAIFSHAGRYHSGIDKLRKEVRDSREDFIRHLARKYQEDLPPIWAVVELMTMGQLSKWFSNIKAAQDRRAISKVYDLNENVMASFCEHLSLVRNMAAHHARLWNRQITKKMKLATHGPENLLQSFHRLPDTNPHSRKLYNTLTMIVYLMDVISPDHNWRVRLKSLISTHDINTHHMGFLSDWESRPLWS